MTWNVENLFPPGYPVSPNKQVTLADYDAKLNYLAQTIDTIKPDVLALNEMEDECYATPAIADGRIYLRTRSALYCFGVRR